jgi:hypothetical protein
MKESEKVSSTRRPLGEGSASDLFKMSQDLLLLFVILGIGIFADDVVPWLRRCWYWFCGKHRADPATCETTVTARCACYPHLEGRGRTKIQAPRNLVAAETLGEAKQGAR